MTILWIFVDMNAALTFHVDTARVKSRTTARAACVLPSACANATYSRLMLTRSKLNRSGGKAQMGLGVRPAQVQYAVLATDAFR
jgi:hypothetical protein